MLYSDHIQCFYAIEQSYMYVQSKHITKNSTKRVSAFIHRETDITSKIIIYNYILLYIVMIVITTSEIEYSLKFTVNWELTGQLTDDDISVCSSKLKPGSVYHFQTCALMHEIITFEDEGVVIITFAKRIH